MSLPPLRKYDLPADPTAVEPPVKRIYVDDDVTLWRSTPGYADYGLFLRRLNQSVIGAELPYTPEGGPSEAVKKTVELLDAVDKWVDEIPPQKTSQRFGNLAFRDWGKKLEEQSATLLQTLLPDSLHPAIPLVQPYLLQSFGSFGRIDYGTGHELSFALFLCSLTLLRFFEPNEKEERAIVLVVFERYLQVVWKLQDTYKLEPAGSHGVWGLDDYCFLPYVWGSGQVQEHLVSRPPDVLNPPLAETTLYNQAINRIHKLKTGPFNEHSSQLHSIASSVPTWWKVNQGLFKMYEAEVLNKRVVVQHIPLGGVIEWGSPAGEGEGEDEQETPAPATGGHLAAPVLGAGGSVHSSPGSTHEALPAGGSPMSSLNPLPAVKNLTLGTSPVRQNSMPRPKGGKIAAALASSPIVPTNPTLHEEEGEGVAHAVAPVTSAEEERTDAAEPDLKKESDVLDPPTSPQNVAKILTANPVDHRLMSSSSASIDKKVAPAPVFIPPEAVVATTKKDEPPTTTTKSPEPAAASSSTAPSPAAVDATPKPTPAPAAARKVSPFERIANLLGCGRRK